MKRRAEHLALFLMIAACTQACNADQEQDNPTTVTEPLQPAAAPGSLQGKISVDGSNTVFPVTRGVAQAFREAHPKVEVAVAVAGTGGGFDKLCNGQLDVADASRPIKAREAASCKAHGVEYMELPIGFDPLSVVVSTRNTFLDCLTTRELRALWEPAAEGKLMSWKALRPSLPDAPVALFGKGKESGTFDYFTLAIVGTESRSRSDYTATEDDASIARSVAADPNALGYFGYAQYVNSQTELKTVAIDAGKGCFAPSAASVSNGSYQPLSRPMFIYVSQAAAARPEVAEFARFYLDAKNAHFVQDVGYVPLPPVSQLAAASRLNRHVLGSALGGHGSVVGVQLDSFAHEERVRNALVQ